MKTETIIERFLEETNYLSNQGIMLLMAYGSRITNTNQSDSDLDIFMITESKHFVASRIIDGIKIEINCFTLEDIEHDILYVNSTRNTYLPSIFKTGKVLKDDGNTYEKLKTLFNCQIERKILIHEDILDLIEENICSFIFKEDKYRDVYYFSTLELIRGLLHYKLDCSKIPADKVYNLYLDETKAKNYCVKLPPDCVRDKYLSALKETNRNKQKQYLIHYLKELKEIETAKSSTNSFFDKRGIKRKLVTLNNQVIKCEDMFLKNNPYANILYNNYEDYALLNIKKVC